MMTLFYLPGSSIKLVHIKVTVFGIAKEDILLDFRGGFLVHVVANERLGSVVCLWHDEIVEEKRPQGHKEGKPNVRKEESPDAHAACFNSYKLAVPAQPAHVELGCKEP